MGYGSLRQSHSEIFSHHIYRVGDVGDKPISHSIVEYPEFHIEIAETKQGIRIAVADFGIFYRHHGLYHAIVGPGLRFFQF